MNEYLIAVDLDGISGVLEARYGDDTHAMFFEINEINRVPKML